MNLYEKITTLLKGDVHLTLSTIFNSFFAATTANALGQYIFIVLAIVSVAAQTYLAISKWLVSRKIQIEDARIKKLDAELEQKKKQLAYDKEVYQFEKQKKEDNGNG